MILVQLTNMCNLSCEYCFSDSCKYELNGEKLLQFLYKYYSKSDNKENMLILSGGEPFIRNDLLMLCEKIVTIAENVKILTNGLVFNKKWLQFVNESNIKLDISLDSISSNYHDTYRGSFKKTKKTIDMLSDIAKNNHSISMTLSYENLKEVDKMIKYTVENNFLLDLNIISLDESKKLSWKNATKEQKEMAMRAIDKWSNLSKRFLKGKIMKRMIIDDSFKVNRCIIKERCLTIQSNGDVTPCFINRDLYYGNIYKNSCEEILKNKDIFSANYNVKRCFSTDCIGIYY